MLIKSKLWTVELRLRGIGRSELMQSSWSFDLLQDVAGVCNVSAFAVNEGEEVP